MNTTTKLQIGLIAIIAFCGLLGCGPQKSGDALSGSSSFGSTGEGPVNGEDISNKTVSELGSMGYAICSRDMNAESDLGFKTMLFYNRSSGNPNHGYLHIRFDRFPTNFSGTASNPAFAVWATTISADGTESSPASLPFGFERIDGANSFTPITEVNYSSASWGDMVNLINYYKLSYTTGAAMMNNYSLIVNLSQYTDTPNLVIKVALYDSSAHIVKYVNALAPVFKADPNVYGANHPVALLNLHPLRTMLGNSWTQQQYITQSASNCF